MLDKVIVNIELKFHYFIREGIDHGPLHVICNLEKGCLTNPFAFFIYGKNKKFMEIVKSSRKANFKGSPFLDYMKT